MTARQVQVCLDNIGIRAGEKAAFDAALSGHKLDVPTRHYLKEKRKLHRMRKEEQEELAAINNKHLEALRAQYGN